MSRSDFWSRRKEAVAKENSTEEAMAEAAVAAETEAELSERSDEELLAELNLPEPEQLENADAVKEFMSSALPQRLKTRALRQLWKLNPVLANLDGLVDYGEDFTDAATVIENMQTAYQVGKGMLSHIEALAEQEEAKEAAEAEAAAGGRDAAETEDAPQDAIALSDEDTSGDHDEVVAEAPNEPYQDWPQDEVEPELVPSRRRMQFEFEMQT